MNLIEGKEQAGKLKLDGELRSYIFRHAFIYL